MTFTDVPPLSTPATAASATFDVSDSQADVTCSLDGAPASPCSGTWWTTGLSIGSHTLVVYATRDGNTGTASYSWTVTPPPTVTITGGPAAGQTVFTSVVSFSFTSQAGASFECSVNGAAFANCSSPTSFFVIVGSESFAVRATVDGVTGPTVTRSFFAL